MIWLSYSLCMIWLSYSLCMIWTFIQFVNDMADTHMPSTAVNTRGGGQKIGPVITRGVHG